jgi:hypothetical protein
LFRERARERELLIDDTREGGGERKGVVRS